MTRYYHIATQLKEAFTKFKLKHIVIENNKIVDLLSKLVGRKKKGQYTTIIQETILEPSLNKVVVSVTLINQEWMTEI